MNWIENSIQEYYELLKSKTFISQNNNSNWYTITTPFIGLFNDCIDIYAKMENGNIILSDDGVTLANLELVGASISRSPKRKEWLEMILLNYGISLNDKELQVIGNEKNFPQKQHNLICAISEISDMAMMAKHTVASIFKEDVKGYLNEQDIIYTEQFIAKGTTGIDFIFDFQIAGRTSEIVLKSFNSLNRINVPNFLFGWEDIKTIREKISGKELKSLAVINNIDREIKSEYSEALRSKGADIILWEERHQAEILNKLKVA